MRISLKSQGTAANCASTVCLNIRYNLSASLDSLSGEALSARARAAGVRRAEGLERPKKNPAGAGLKGIGSTEEIRCAYGEQLGPASRQLEALVIAFEIEVPSVPAAMARPAAIIASNRAYSAAAAPLSSHQKRERNSVMLSPYPAKLRGSLRGFETAALQGFAHRGHTTIGHRVVLAGEVKFGSRLAKGVKGKFRIFEARRV